MTDLTALLQSGASGWLFLPTAILLGALHGLEPGHSKSMMAAFVVAIRGTVGQAALLGLCATLSHTAVVWAIALAGLHFGRQWNNAATEPYLQIISAVIMVVIAVWMAWRVHRSSHAHHHDHDHDHDHDHEHEHEHEDEHDHDDDDDHESLDAHAAAHAREIQTRFAGQHVTRSQIILFGLTGGLIPCPASITVLLLCLQLKQIALGLTLVLGFSIGLALTLVLSGVIAALSMRHLQSRWSGFATLTQRAPYISCVLILLVALMVGYHGYQALP